VTGVPLEVEAKLAVDPDFELPPLDGAVAGLEAGPVEHVPLEATYLDAPDLRLVRAGISLRHRTGEGGAAGAWTLKLPTTGADDGRGVLRRREVVVPGAADDLPSTLAVQVRPWLRTAVAGPVAVVRTTRRRVVLRVEDVVVGEVDDDAVEVLQAGEVVSRFREVEVETPDDAVLAAVVDRLRAAGAGAPDPTPKHVRALGAAAREPADLVVGEVGPGSTAAEVLRAGIASAVLRIVEHDAVVRAGIDPEGVHQARVGCRRLRSDLRTFRSLVDPEWAEPLRDELRWLGGELGAARDLDVLRLRLRHDVEELDGSVRAAADAALTRLDRDRERAATRAVDALDSDRYLALLDRLVEAADRPRLVDAAGAPAADVLPALAGETYAKLRKAVRRLDPDPPDEALHEVRIKAKRARYAADVAVPVVGAPAKRYTKALAGLQGVLGDHHDCVVAEEWLTTAAGTATPAQAFALGLLVGAQRQEADRLRREWRTAWRRVRAPERTDWMR
jgi:CHAD domain-containing protein